MPEPLHIPKTWHLTAGADPYTTQIKEGQKLMGWVVEQPHIKQWFAVAVVYTPPVPWASGTQKMLLMGRRVERSIPGTFDNLQHALDAIVAEHVTHKMEV